MLDMPDRIRYIDSITEGVSRWVPKCFGRSTYVSRGSVPLVNLVGALEHLGVYLVEARVAELYNDHGAGWAKIVPLCEFLYGQDVEATLLEMMDRLHLCEKIYKGHCQDII